MRFRLLQQDSSASCDKDEERFPTYTSILTLLSDMSALSGHQQQQQNAGGSASLAIDSNSASGTNSATTTTTGGGGVASNNMNLSSINENSSSNLATMATAAASAPMNHTLSSSMSSASLLSTQSHMNGAMFNNGQAMTMGNNPNSNNGANGNNGGPSGNGNGNSTGGNSNAASMSACSHSGYLQKWTNYIKGYQKRWFVLNNGLLSYYRSQAEMAHTCRGTINLLNAQIQSEDACHFVVTNGGTQTFHLKAASEFDKQKWVSALELAKTRAKQFGHNFGPGIGVINQQDSDDEDNSVEAEKNELASMLRNLQQKLDDLSTSHEFVLKHSNALTKSLTDLESIQSKPEESTIKTINERSTLYKITMLAVVNSCQEFINLAQSQMRKMHKVLQSERDMRTKLEDMVQEMAKQHLNFETQLNKRSKRNTIVRPLNPDGSVNSNLQSRLASGQGGGGAGNAENASNISSGNRGQLLADSTNRNDSGSKRSSQTTRNRNVNNEKGGEESEGNNNDGAGGDENDDQFVDNDEFHDAVEDVTQFSITLPRQPGLHQRNLSNISKLYLQESDISDEDDEHQTIKVTMHSNKDAQAAQPVISVTSTTVDNQKPATTAATKPGQLTTKKASASSDLTALKMTAKAPKERRKEITPRPNYSLNLWSIMKNSIGRDLSKIPIPVNFSEPLSMLQRVTEELEYSNLLDLAAQCEDQWEQMAYVAAFTITAYSTTANRTNKPFNPLLGETYECDRLDDYGLANDRRTSEPPSAGLCNPHGESQGVDVLPGVCHVEQVPRSVSSNYSAGHFASGVQANRPPLHVAQSVHIRAKYHRRQAVDRQRRRNGHHQPQDQRRVPSQVLCLFVFLARTATQGHRHHNRLEQRRQVRAERHVDRADRRELPSSTHKWSPIRPS